MQWTNSDRSYGWLTIILHWIAVIGVLDMFVIGLTAGAHEAAGDHAAHRQAMYYHVSTGAVLFVFLLARVVQHYVQKQPEKSAQSKLLNTIATVNHHALLIGILIMIVSGPLAVWSTGNPINVFGVFAVPTPFAERNMPVHEAAEIAHLIGRIILFFAIILHVLAALKHVFFDRDGVMRRMLYPSTLKKPA